MQQIEQTWSSYEVLDVIEGYLFRKPEDAQDSGLMELEAYRELLLLHSVAKEIINTHGVPTVLGLPAAVAQAQARARPPAGDGRDAAGALLPPLMRVYRARPGSGWTSIWASLKPRQERSSCICRAHRRSIWSLKARRPRPTRRCLVRKMTRANQRPDVECHYTPFIAAPARPPG